ncbi:MAG: glycosyl transferase [Desulfobacterales bacterium]|nr:MAG: glycosyl transferase [Desulfobacterales bacterium]
MKIIQYCQHVLGIGHLFRSLEIARALSDHEVVLVTGGPRVDTNLPAHVREIRLPDLQMNPEFKGLYSSQKNTPLDQIKEQRQRRLFELFEKEKPAVFLVELFPFGRKAFRFEIDPVLQAIGDKRLPACRVVCSVRDILVEKEDAAKHELRAVETLNRYFAAVLVHADPKLAQISETFARFDEIKIPVIYTGYIARRPSPDAGAKMRRRLQIGRDEILIVASAGGGNVGAPLLEAVIDAFDRLQVKNRPYLKVFTGPYLDQDEFSRLQRLAGDDVEINKFSPDFVSYMAAADLSVSMGGYNTTMNILATGIPALVWPFPQNREQRMRAERLDQMGILKVVADEDLEPDRLADIMARVVSTADRVPAGIDLNGAANTAAWIEKLKIAD